ncbi:MAG: FprA family A-type flavoprotein [Bacteroidales bacterium]|jgi:flavorubredoxin|nr:FprA family A-type flavoprotein [Bacteroidales bacterium]
MQSDNKVHDVSPSVKWCGVLDHDIVTFDVVMETKHGTTYNSYFIDAERKALIETVKEDFWEVYLEKLRQITNPEEIDYIILNHTEPDHSGSLANLLKLAPGATVVGTGNAIRYLKEMIYTDFPHIVVKDGYTLDLGNKTLQFISAPNLHWPDTMYTYLAEEKILFTCDSFGAHYCHDGVFDDKVGDFDEDFRYYFDVILKPFSKFMLKAIEKVNALDINLIAPGHGPVLRSGWKKRVELSEKWAKEHLDLPVSRKVFIPYVSAYHKTGKIAEKIREGIISAGSLEAEILDIEMTSIGDLEQKVAESAALIVGSTTINQNILLPVYKLFSVINPLRDKGKLAGGFGSYGWSGESKDLIKSNLENLKLNYFGEGVFVKFTPSLVEEEQAFAYGKAFGEELLAGANPGTKSEG